MAANHFRHAYFAVRNVPPLMVVLGTIMWAAYGWDSTLETTFFGRGAYGYGIHWSTFQTVFLAIWIISINLQTGGLRSVGQLGREMKKDLAGIVREVQILGNLAEGFFFGKPDLKRGAREDFADLRGGYDYYSAVDPGRGFFFAIAFSLVAALAFELIWVPIYNQVNFGNWAWPVYYYGNPLFGNPILSEIFLRNNFMLLACLVFGAGFLYLAFDGDLPGKLTRRFEISWRLDRKWAILLLAAAGSWVVWVFFPHSKYDPTQLFNTPGAITSFHATDSASLWRTTWSFPSQSLFPQTEYTFYNSSVYLKSYSETQIFGFWIDNPSVHFVNVMTKYLTFAAVCYPVMVFAKRRIP